MLASFSRRLLTLLQLTRMALVFTAIADSQAALLLAAAAGLGPGQALRDALHPGMMLAVAVISVGLYGFGMSLNDIIDRRRDRHIAAHRPIPSGRIPLATAHAICGMLAVAALAGGVLLRLWGGGYLNLLLVVFTLGLIAFYDFAGKYLVGPGLLTLGLVRFFHALIPAASMRGADLATLTVPVPWHPLLLLNHVVVLSTIAYAWEEKRPPLTRRHWWGVLGSLALIDVLVVLWAGRRGPGGFVENLNLRPGLALPLAAAGVFAVIAWQLRRQSKTSREAGQKAMLYGLLWLIVYDACFVGAYVGWAPAVALGLLLPVAYAAVQLMRWWSKIVAVSQRPEFKRAGT
jgi:4-hydroxybenzoate polyprenyltransferase